MPEFWNGYARLTAIYKFLWWATISLSLIQIRFSTNIKGPCGIPPMGMRTGFVQKHAACQARLLQRWPNSPSHSCNKQLPSQLIWEFLLNLNNVIHSESSIPMTAEVISKVLPQWTNLLTKGKAEWVVIQECSLNTLWSYCNCTGHIYLELALSRSREKIRTIILTSTHSQSRGLHRE